MYRNIRGGVQRLEKVGDTMRKNNDSIFNMIVNIMEIEHDPEYIIELRKWINDIGIDEVFKKVIQMNSTYLMK